MERESEPEQPSRFASETLVFLGAGASADAGLPTAAELHDRLIEALGPLYINLARLVFRDRVDVERLFRVIEFIHAVETEKRPGERRRVYQSTDVARLVERWQPALQEYFDAQRHTVRGTATGSLIDGLFRALRDQLWLTPLEQPDLGYLRQLLNAMRGGTIATINYDNTLERSAVIGVPCPLDADPHPRDRGFQYPGMSNWVRVIKVHGSLNWKADPQTGDVSVISENDMPLNRFVDHVLGHPTHTPAVIFGAGNKLRPDGPYLDLYQEFRTALQQARRVVIIGYSFSDEHVNELLRRWVTSSRSYRVMRVSSFEPGARLPVAEAWFAGHRHAHLQVVTGAAAAVMDDLLRDDPELLK